MITFIITKSTSGFYFQIATVIAIKNFRKIQRSIFLFHTLCDFFEKIYP